MREANIYRERQTDKAKRNWRVRHTYKQNHDELSGSGNMWPKSESILCLNGRSKWHLSLVPPSISPSVSFTHPSSCPSVSSSFTAIHSSTHYALMPPSIIRSFIQLYIHIFIQPHVHYTFHGYFFLFHTPYFSFCFYFMPLSFTNPCINSFNKSFFHYCVH